MIISTYLSVEVVVVVVVGIREYGTCDLEKKIRAERIWKEIRTGDLPYIYVLKVS